MHERWSIFLNSSIFKIPYIVRSQTVLHNKYSVLTTGNTFCLTLCVAIVKDRHIKIIVHTFIFHYIIDSWKLSMFWLMLLWNLSMVCCEVTRQSTIGTHPQKLGIGRPLNRLDGVTRLTCVLQCKMSVNCSAANYDAGNCTLLQSQDPSADWRQKTHTSTGEYMCEASLITGKWIN